MKLKEAPDDKLIATYVKIRDTRAQLRAEYENADAENRGKQDKIEAEFLRRFHERGATSTKSDAGTAYLNISTSVRVADKDVYFQWILQNPEERMCFLETRASKTAVDQYRNEHDDIPPGVNYQEIQNVGFRRS